jgi:hypothetical protein
MVDSLRACCRGGSARFESFLYCCHSSLFLSLCTCCHEDKYIIRDEMICKDSNFHGHWQISVSMEINGSPSCFRGDDGFLSVTDSIIRTRRLVGLGT